MNRFFSEKPPAFVRRVIKWLRGDAPVSVRRRDNCPAWVKDEAISKAVQKRARRAAKRREDKYAGGWNGPDGHQMYQGAENLEAHLGRSINV